MKYLFELDVMEVEPAKTIKCYFNLIYDDGLFLDALENFSRGESYVRDGICCLFPDYDSPDENDHFQGFKFDVSYPFDGSGEVLVGKDVFFQHLDMACSRYLVFHPEDCGCVKKLLGGVNGFRLKQ